MSEVVIELYSSAFGLSFYILRPKTIDMLTFSTHLHKYQNWVSLSKMLNEELPDATENDLLHEDQCIICRLKMKIRNINGILKSDAKRLPCGHCYHLSCLQQWIRQQMKCPLCQYDLKQLIEPPEAENEEEGNDNDNFNDFFAFFENLNGHDNIIRNAHDDFRNEIENRDENARPRWRIIDILTWIAPANNVNDENEQIHTHHHRHHHHHRSTHKTNRNDDAKKEHRHRHHHHHKKNVENLNTVNQPSIGNENQNMLNDKSFAGLKDSGVINMQNCIEEQTTDLKTDYRNISAEENTN